MNEKNARSAAWIARFWLSDGNVKSLMAAGAIDGVLSLGFWEAQHVLTMLAFAIDVGLAVSALAFLQLEKACEAALHAQVPLIFALTLVEVAREYTENDICAECCFGQGKDQRIGEGQKKIDDDQDQINHQQRASQRIGAVSAVHPAVHSLAE